VLTEKILVIDCQLAGIAGDMLVGALLDLGVDIQDFIDVMGTASKYLEGCEDLRVSVEDVDRHGFRAKKLTVNPPEHSHVEEEHQESHGHTHPYDHNDGEHHHHEPEHSHDHHVHGRDIRNAVKHMIEDLSLSGEAISLGLSAVDSLIEAEAKMHGGSPEHVHLHEAGSIDTVVDIVGTVFAMERLGLFEKTKIYSTPVAVGGGLFEFSHGRVSSPAPATLEILRSKNFPMKGGPISFELTTPTGAALLVNMVDEVHDYYPGIKPTRIGYGAGTKNFEVMANVVRLTLGVPFGPFFLDEEIVTLETNVDDVSGEIMGHTIESVMAAGAKDISVIPTTTKKNRPGYIVKVVTDREHSDRMTLKLMEETGTLGVRAYMSHRHVLPREIRVMRINLSGVDEEVRYKVSETLTGEVIQVKPEYEDLLRISEKTGKPIRQLMELAKRKIASNW